jgi:hypothetical protein
MGVRSSIANFARTQAEAATAGREKAEDAINLDEMFFQPRKLGDLALKHVCELVEDVSWGIEYLLSPNVTND